MMSAFEFLEQVASEQPIMQISVLVAAICILLFDATRKKKRPSRLAYAQKKASDALIYVIAAILFGISTVIVWIWFLSIGVFYIFGSVLVSRKDSDKQLSDSQSDLTMNPSSLPLNRVK